VVGERSQGRRIEAEPSWGRVGEEEEKRWPAAFFASEGRSNGVMGRWHRSAHLNHACGSSDDGASARLLPRQSAEQNLPCRSAEPNRDVTLRGVENC
jgi:hypothetical protein